MTEAIRPDLMTDEEFLRLQFIRDHGSKSGEVRFLLELVDLLTEDRDSEERWAEHYFRAWQRALSHARRWKALAKRYRRERALASSILAAMRDGTPEEVQAIREELLVPAKQPATPPPPDPEEP